MTLVTVIASRNSLLDDIKSQLFRRTEDAQHVNHAVVVQRHYNSTLEFSIAVNSLVYSKHQYHYHAVMGK
jgi:hypothetical protein